MKVPTALLTAGDPDDASRWSLLAKALIFVFSALGLDAADGSVA